MNPIKALFAWLFGKFVSEQKEQDNLTKTKYTDSKLGKDRREKFMKDLQDKSRNKRH